jgi:sugar lactone lactonase YvrE
LVAQAAVADVLYIGDWFDSSVQSYDADTGAYLGAFVSTGSGGILGINGLIFDQNHDLLAVNQNVATIYSGAVLRYSGSTGAYLGPLVSQNDPNAPWAPRGMVLGKDGKLYVADMGEVDAPPPGYIDRYNATTGAFIDRLTAPGLPVTFQPRGMVFGPDGLLYVTNFEDYPSTGTGQAGLGSILRFDPTTGAYLGQFVNRDGSSGGPPLMSPEGLVFGPNGDLYALSLGDTVPGNAHDDYIIRYNGQTGAYVSSIDIGTAINSRLAAALLFGPDGKLYVPMSNTGEVRRYDVNTGTYTSFIAPGGPLKNPWFLTFGNTDSATLGYVPEPSTWAPAVSGNWSDPTKWTGGVPGGVGATALFNVPTFTPRDDHAGQRPDRRRPGTGQFSQQHRGLHAQRRQRPDLE